MFEIILLTALVPFIIGKQSPALLSFQNLIVGGKPTRIEDHPWQVSLQANGYHYCGGSIISESIVLTAGHCSGYPIDLIRVRAGTSNATRGGSVHSVRKIIRHEDFDTSQLGVPFNDIAILVLDIPIALSTRAQPVHLFEQSEMASAGTNATLSGWGSLIENGSKQIILHSVDVAIVAKSNCTRAYEDWGGIPDGQICAAHPAGGKDTCQGDSGGPLVIAGRQAGIVSWGNGCARWGYPGVYTEVGFFRQWITEHAGI